MLTADKLWLAMKAFDITGDAFNAYIEWVNRDSATESDDGAPPPPRKSKPAGGGGTHRKAKTATATARSPKSGRKSKRARTGPSPPPANFALPAASAALPSGSGSRPALTATEGDVDDTEWTSDRDEGEDARREDAMEVDVDVSHEDALHAGRKSQGRRASVGGRSDRSRHVARARHSARKLTKTGMSVSVEVPTLKEVRALRLRGHDTSATQSPMQPRGAEVDPDASAQSAAEEERHDASPFPRPFFLAMYPNTWTPKPPRGDKGPYWGPSVSDRRTIERLRRLTYSQDPVGANLPAVYRRRRRVQPGYSGRREGVM